MTKQYYQTNHYEIITKSHKSRLKNLNCKDNVVIQLFYKI
jgi:hypothetical protein